MKKANKDFPAQFLSISLYYLNFINHIKPITITKWATTWLDKDIIEGASGKERITSYRIGELYKDLILNDLGYRKD